MLETLASTAKWLNWWKCHLNVDLVGLKERLLDDWDSTVGRGIFVGTYLIMPAVNILNVINKWQRVAMWLLAAVTVATCWLFFSMLEQRPCVQCFDAVGWHQEEHLACKHWVMRCWCGYLSGARCRLFAYGPANATASPKPHSLLPHLNLDWFHLFGTGLPMLSWKRGC